ncbi:unnamed protein product, partial [marine sediment metagenome]
TKLLFQWANEELREVYRRAFEQTAAAAADSSAKNA